MKSCRRCCCCVPPAPQRFHSDAGLQQLRVLTRRVTVRSTSQGSDPAGHRDEHRSLLTQSSCLVESPLAVVPQVRLFFLRWETASPSEPDSACGTHGHTSHTQEPETGLRRVRLGPRPYGCCRRTKELTSELESEEEEEDEDEESLELSEAMPVDSCRSTLSASAARSGRSCFRTLRHKQTPVGPPEHKPHAAVQRPTNRTQVSSR